MKKLLLILSFFFIYPEAFSWGFYAHRRINYYAVFLLPPEMIVLYKPHIDFLTEHAVDPDKRRYMVAEEGPRHYIDIDHYGLYPFTDLPRKWNDAVEKYSKDSLNKHGIAPWWIQTMLARLTEAFKDKNQSRILKLSAEIGHYLADIHVPLHACSNHNGQYTGQHGIHGLWESRIPEVLAESDWDFFLGKAAYLNNPLQFTWNRVLESAAASDSVLKFERQLTAKFSTDHKYAFEDRNGLMVRQYSRAFTIAYDEIMNNMVERRMRQSILAVASFWFSAWVNAGQPDLKSLSGKDFSDLELQEFKDLTHAWQSAALPDECGHRK